MWIHYQDCKRNELLGKMNIVHHMQAAANTGTPAGNSGSGILVQETKVDRCSENQLNIESSKLDVLSGYQESEKSNWRMLNKPERISRIEIQI